MKDLEEYVLSKKPQNSSGKEVYEMCDNVLKEINDLESTFGAKSKPKKYQ
jgi:hypothetical protein